MAVSEFEISGRLNCFILNQLAWCGFRFEIGSQTLKFESLAFFSHSTAGPIPVNSNWSTVGLSGTAQNPPKGITTKTSTHSTRLVPRRTAGMFNKQCAAKLDKRPCQCLTLLPARSPLTMLPVNSAQFGFLEFPFLEHLKDFWNQ